MVEISINEMALPFRSLSLETTASMLSSLFFRCHGNIYGGDLHSAQGFSTSCKDSISCRLFLHVVGAKDSVVRNMWLQGLLCLEHSSQQLYLTLMEDYLIGPVSGSIHILLLILGLVFISQNCHRVQNFLPITDREIALIRNEELLRRRIQHLEDEGDRLRQEAVTSNKDLRIQISDMKKQYDTDEQDLRIQISDLKKQYVAATMHRRIRTIGRCDSCGNSLGEGIGSYSCCIYCEDSPCFHHGRCCQQNPNATRNSAPIRAEELTINSLRERLSQARVKFRSTETKEELIVRIVEHDKKFKNQGASSGKT